MKADVFAGADVRRNGRPENRYYNRTRERASLGAPASRRRESCNLPAGRRRSQGFAG